MDVVTMKDQYAELAELAGGFIHDLKNHLSTLGLNLQLLAEDFQQPQSQRERRALTRVHKLQAQCQQLVDMANDFLRFARIKDLALAPADMGRVLEEMIDFFAPQAQKRNIEIRSYIPADLPRVSLDLELFRLALLNLMLNAEQAMPEGGEITMQAMAESRNREDDASAVVLHLIDTGKGMSPEVLARVFEAFYSTKEDGSGLGLPTTKRIVEAHGGSICVESAEGHGTKFTIRLPALAEAPAAV
jgi:signal transduction histidine kinase